MFVRAEADGGKITLDDLKTWKRLISVNTPEPVGNYRGHEVMSGDLIVYALHLNEALDVKASGSAAASAESVYKQIRIMEEVFLSAKDFAKSNDGQYADHEYARKRADFVLNSEPRPLTIDAIFNTCFLVERDEAGNVAWGTHSINTPTAFGAGIVVDGIYAAHAMNREHVRGGGGSAPGISTSYALFKDGSPRLVVGSPGFGFVHGPYQYGTGIMEWGLSPTAAMNMPRFSLPNRAGVSIFEQHYDQSVFKMLDQRNIKYSRGRPTTSTGTRRRSIDWRRRQTPRCPGWPPQRLRASQLAKGAFLPDILISFERRSMKPITTLLLVLFASLSLSAGESKPNIILIMVDDMGYSDIGCYGGEVNTPNIDMLAKNGLRFTQFYNTAKCHTTRAELLTGNYAYQIGDQDMAYGATFGEVLRTVGYRTLIAGKWHQKSAADHARI